MQKPAPDWMLKSAPGTLIPWSVHPVEIEDESRSLVVIDTGGRKFFQMPENEPVKTVTFSVVRLTMEGGMTARYWMREG